jgi:hypothetical protein
VDDLNDLASAANQASPYRRRAIRRVKRQPGSMPLVLAIVFGVLLVGGAIIYFSMGTGSSPPAPTAVNDRPGATGDARANEPDTAEVRAQVGQFKEFASRLAEALGNDRKSALQAENTSPDLVIRYTCKYMIEHLGTRTAPSGRPTEFLAQFSGAYEGIGEGYRSKDTTELSAAFTLSPSGQWTIAIATERPITHSTTTDFMGVPVKGGPKRDIANLDWFNAAVVDAQKPSSAR